MDPSDLAKNYDKIAEHWDGPNFNRNNGIDLHNKAIRLLSDELATDLNMLSKTKAIDIGCGSSGRLIDLMLASNFDVEGLDYSSNMLSLAQARHPDIHFHHADICDWEFKHKYDFISAWDSIWHVPLERQESVLHKLCNALSHNGVIIFTSGAVDEAGDSSNLFLNQELYHAALGTQVLLRILSDNSCVCRHLENDDYPNYHLAIIAQKIES